MATKPAKSSSQTIRNATNWLKSFRGSVTLLIAAVFCILPIIANAAGNAKIFLGVLMVILIYTIYAASWDFLTGFVGQASFGHVIFLGISAVAYSIIVGVNGMEWYVGLLLAALMAVLVAILLGLPLQRMAGPYFTLGTLAVGVVFLLVWLLPVLEEPIPLIGFPGSGGLQGLAVDPISNNQLLVYFIVLGFTVLSLAVMILIGKSKMGTIFKAIRDDDMGAKASGINIVKYKMIALMISAFFAGIAGALLAQKSGGASTSTFSATYSFLPIILVMMGGLTTISGSALGAFIYVVYDNIVPYIKTIPVIAANQVALDFVVASPTLIFAVILMLVIRFAPDGLLNPMFNKLQKAWDLMAGK